MKDLIQINFINSTEIFQKPAFANFLSDGTLIISTYEQNSKDELLRKGSFEIFPNTTTKFDICHTIPVNAGIFRFEVIKNSNKILASLTNGHLMITDFFQGAKVKSENYSSSISNGMLLSAKWNENSSQILCSDNFGNLFITNKLDMNLEKKWRAHTLKYSNELNCEVWNCCWLQNNNFQCASGSEDELLKIWDLRTNCQTPCQINKSHESGIVFLNQFEDNQIISGSYDENMRIFDLRNLKEALIQVKLNGGVWNITKINANYFLASCMYGGWSIIQCDSIVSKLIYCNDECGLNLLYATASTKINNNEFRIATCTFNDKKIYEYNLKLL